MGIGGVLGLLAGFTGTGGGIFLTPVLLLNRWAHTKQAAAVSAVFILCNSIAGLAGNIKNHQVMPPLLWISTIAVAAGIGGGLGSYLGSQRFSPILIKQVLAAVLVIAGLKLLLTV